MSSSAIYCRCHSVFLFPQEGTIFPNCSLAYGNFRIVPSKLVPSHKQKKTLWLTVLKIPHVGTYSHDGTFFEGTIFRIGCARGQKDTMVLMLGSATRPFQNTKELCLTPFSHRDTAGGVLEGSQNPHPCLFADL